jgi:hypothetical protein
VLLTSDLLAALPEARQQRLQTLTGKLRGFQEFVGCLRIRRGERVQCLSSLTLGVLVRICYATLEFADKRRKVGGRNGHASERGGDLLFE